MRRLQRTLFAIVLPGSWTVAATAAAQGLCFVPTPPDPAIAGQPPVDAERYEITQEGDFTLSADGALDASGQVRLRYLDAILNAERIRISTAGAVEAGGSVSLSAPDVSVFAEDAFVDPDAERITLGRAGFELPLRPARGSADTTTLDRGAQTISLTNMRFTTCPEEQVDWELLARDVELDTDQGFGTARGVRLRFKGVPVLYAPYFTFPIDDQRKSGFLSPNFSERDRTGLDVTVPYYLNLAPNHDLLLTPRYLSRRGVQLNTEFRYLMPSSDGRLDFEFLPDDDAAGLTRRYVNLQHRSRLGTGWQLITGIEQVSDSAYFEDLGNSLAVTSQTHLNRFLDLSFLAPYWSLLTRFQNYQTIDTLIAPEDRPYERMPQMLFEGTWGEGLFGFESTTELANFDRDIGTTGWRLDATQELSLNFERRGKYLTPAVAWRQTNYWLDDDGSVPDTEPSRSLPIASLDGGFRFERTAGRNDGWIHTLEPRLLYVHVPYEDQSTLPVFDTILPDFNLIQLFRKYQYIGADRIADTSQLSLGITTRLIDQQTGRERLTATLGQTRYHEPQRTSLPDAPQRAQQESDYVAEMSVTLSERWNLDIGYQWNSATRQTARAESRFEFRPQPNRLFGLGYRYRRGTLEQGDLSLVWPLAQQWRFIGRYSYSLLDKKPLEQFAGLEFEACCWRIRLVGRRYVSRRTGEIDSSISVQFQLNGLGQGAAPPEELLDRGILGYRQIGTTSMQ